MNMEIVEKIPESGGRAHLTIDYSQVLRWFQELSLRTESYSDDEDLEPSKYSRTCSIDDAVKLSAMKNKKRYNAIEASFKKHSKGFPESKNMYFQEMANSLCRLSFIDSLSEYDEYDDTINTFLKLHHGVTLRLSQFLDEDVKSPAVFSIYCGDALLIADEMPVYDIANILNSIHEKVDA
jgi:hypothetical protein